MLKTPDITPAQVMAALQLLVAFLVSRLLISNGQAQLVLEIAGIVVPGITIAADAYIRKGRVGAVVATIQADVDKAIHGYHAIQAVEAKSPTPPPAA